MSGAGSVVINERVSAPSGARRWGMVMLRAVIYVVMATYAVAWFVLTHLPRPPGLGMNLFGDKVAHYLGYGALTGLMYMTLWVSWPGRRWVVVLSLPMALAYGAVDEVTQPFFGRTCELHDWVADAAGAGTAVGGWELLRMAGRLLRKHRGG